MAEPITYAIASWLFLRLLGLIYLVAFVSVATQISGLSGSAGIVPASEVLATRDRGRISRFWRLPTLCWLSSSDRFLLFLSWGGAAFAAVLSVGFAPMLMLVLLWVFYLSLFNVCRLFLGYQWDVLLLEAGFLAIFLAPARLWPGFDCNAQPSPVIIWLFWWLLFRLVFSSGFVKLRSADRTWRNLTALCYHYETQPLPTALAWYAHQLPRWFHRTSTATVLLIELLGPVLILGPDRVRYGVCAVFVALMLVIEITGNYAFFNLLAAALSLLLLDDRFWRGILPESIVSRPGRHVPPVDGIPDAVSGVLALVLLFVSCDVVAKLFRGALAWPRPLLKCLNFLAPFHLVNSYGLFAVMTTQRPEILVEGSEDGLVWEAYEFKWKAGSINRAPRFVAPHQPRLDWQMWFAALGYCENNPWFVRFLVRLLEGSKPVIKLLKANPFPEKPPRYVRASIYNYGFTDLVQRKTSRKWWRAELRGTYCGVTEIADARDNLAR